MFWKHLTERSKMDSGHTCLVNHINTLRIIVEQANEFQATVYLIFADFKQAFDKPRSIVEFVIAA